MNDWNEYLLRVARSFLEEQSLSGNDCAIIHGSLARWEADCFSDIDITIYSPVLSSQDLDQNQVYAGEILQIERLEALPTYQAIEQDPWQHRFLLEALPLHDLTGQFSALQKWLKEYLRSNTGRTGLLMQVIRTIDERKQWARECSDQQLLCSAAIWAKTAWTEAAFLYAFLAEELLSPTHIFRYLQKNEPAFQKYQKHCGQVPVPCVADILDGAKTVEHFRRHAKRTQNEAGTNTLLHDVLCGLKLKRAMQNAAYSEFLWSLYAEALWIYIEGANEIDFEEYRKAVPKEVDEGLGRLGFTELSAGGVQELFDAADELLEHSKKLL